MRQEKRFLLWNTQSPTLNCLEQYCAGESNSLATLDGYFSRAKKQLAVYHVAYAQNMYRKNGKCHKSFTVRNQELVNYYHNKAAFHFNYPVELGQSLCQKPEYHINFKNRYQELSHHILSHVPWINTQLYPKALSQMESFNDCIDAQVIEKFGWLDQEMLGILCAYLKQKPQRAIFLIDIEPVNKNNPDLIFANPQYYFRWIESAYQVITSELRKLQIPYITVLSGKGYHIVSSIELWENHRYNPAMFALMDVGGVLHQETCYNLIHTHQDPCKNFPTPFIAQKIHQGIYKIMHYLLANLADKIRTKMQAKGFPPYLGFCDDGDNLVSLDMTAMLYRIDRRSFAVAGQIYGKNHKFPMVRIVREINGYDFFVTNNEKTTIKNLLKARSNLDKAQNHMAYSGAKIPVASSNGFLKLIEKYHRSRIKDLHRQVEIPLLENIESFCKDNYKLVRRYCPSIEPMLSAPGSDIFLNPKSLKYFYEQLQKKGFGINYQYQLTHALYCDPYQKINIPTKDCRALWALWPLILHSHNFRD